jgi:hypothetical protein
MALREAGLGGRRAARAEVGLYMHCYHAPVWAESEHITAVLANDYHIDRLTAFPCVVPNSVCGNVARVLSLTGHNATYCLGEGGALGGLALAAMAVRHGRAGRLLSVSSDEIPGGVLGASLGELHGRAEGAAALLLQGGATVGEDDGRCLAEVRGSAMSFGEREPVGERMRATIERALHQAAVAPEEIDTVCCDVRQSGAVEALRSLAPLSAIPILDLGQAFGYPVSSGGVLTLALVLLSRRMVADSGTKYILTLSASPTGYHTAVVFSTETAGMDLGH